MNYENENWRVCEDSRGISADSKEMGESGIDSPSKDSFGVQVLQRGEPSGASESGDSERTPYGYIYITENLINGKRYIGQHKSQVFDKYYKGSGSVLRSAFDKYGWENFKTDVLEWCYSEGELYSREIYWVDKYNAVESSDFYNLVPGGKGGDYFHMLSPDRQAAMIGVCREKGREASIRTADERSRKQKGISRKERNPESIEKQRSTMRESYANGTRKPIHEKGKSFKMSKPMSSRGRENISKAKIGKPAPNRKPVKCVELSMVFSHAEEAKKFLGVNSVGTGCISSCAKKYDSGDSSKVAYGYHWSYNV